MNLLTYDDIEIKYSIKRSKRKTIGIRISIEGEIIVSAPLRCSDLEIKRILNDKAPWIISKLKLVKSRSENIKLREYEDGEKLMLLGDLYILKIYYGDYRKCSAKFENKSFNIYIDKNVIHDKRKELIKTLLSGLYRELGRRLFIERTKHYSNILRLYPNNIRIKEQKSVWGSCSTKNNINYNWRIIMSPMEIVDYIVVHELCHLKHHNHSKEYWQLVQSILPNYEKSEEWLKQNGVKLNLDMALVE